MRLKMNRRTFLKVTGTAVLAGALAGCGGSGSGNGGGNGGNPGGGDGPENPGGGEEPGTPGGGEEPDNPGSGEEKPEKPGLKAEGNYKATDANGVIWTYYYDGHSAGASLTGYDPIHGAEPTGVLTLPDVLDEIPITSVGKYAFRQGDKEMLTKVTELIVPASITVVEDYAFATWGNSPKPLQKVTFLAKRVVYGSDLFEWDENLTEIVGIENLVPSEYCAAAFRGTGFTDITLTDNLACILGFNVCDKLKTVTLEKDVKEVRAAIFFSCVALSKVTIKNGPTIIRNQAFGNCSRLEKIYIPTSIKTVEEKAFQSERNGIPYADLQVYYEGTPEQWKAIEIAEKENERLLNATVHYGQKPEQMEETAVQTLLTNLFS